MSDLPMGEERRARGRAARQQAPRSTHDAIGNVDRDPVELLKQSSAGRVEALVPLRYGRMLVSPFTFYRGSAILQAHDLAGTPDSGIHMQICGDCHLSNFGGFATPERSLIFDLNDFDETAVGPWEWDVKRLVASFTIAGRHLGHGDAAADEFAFCAAESYRTRMGEYADMGVLDLWYERITFDRMYDAVQTDDARRRIKRGVERATRRTHETMLPKLADRTENEWQIRDAPPAIFHIRGKNTLFDPDDDVMSLTAHRDDILAPVLSEYFSSLTVERAALLKQFTIQDLVFKVVGVGSVGTRCMVLLLIEPHGKPLFLQLKEASKSVVSMFFKGAPDDPADPSHAGRRVVHGQRLMQAATDLFLGWSTGPLGRALYVRQLRDMKISAELETFGVDAFRDYAALCGWVLARAHAKASGRALEIAGYLGSGQRMADALVRYGRAYADQVEKDYDAFRAACRDGRLEARSDADMAADFAP
ncbi:hypothetical protein AWB81_04307 [Caballeronia arationis]|jgi:uncharacterized protein (DUF2252 family)|uniref:Uncharacterized conserved protein, DUF2252 family n=1 Tax=Caballeronia arationis TaxID=1777142 RepID=A0A7Z7I548_9BURK|nr:DUF2252 domain-containing protein [Caballeronia arationis]SAK84716.1 hypothetical protein AWB81_04307 [Caballeronia arationis]SOE61961.1 Uncharacterized conserved protein, DUF2252 family [Caballeronia arationis]